MKKLLFILLVYTHAMHLRADALDDLIEKQIAQRAIPGLSLPVIQNGTIIKAKGYGFTGKTHKTPITPATLFQAGSVSKAVAAMELCDSYRTEPSRWRQKSIQY